MTAVNWTPEAEITFSQNLEYLASRWDNRVVTNFINKVDEALQVIAANPEAFPVHNTALNIRKCVVTPQITVYYHIINAGNIDLLTFWNNYQDPGKLKLR